MVSNLIKIKGGYPLRGSAKINGAKNAAVAIIPATILAGGPCVLENIPRISDVLILCDILQGMGAEVRWQGAKTLVIDTAGINNVEPPTELAAKFRASYYFMGALLGRFGQARVGLPGGCQIGPRPIDQHIKGFRALGSAVDVEQGSIALAGELKGSHIYLDVVTVGGTINIMLAAAGAQGTTIIENAAREPEIIDMANFLTGIGVGVRGAGTGTIRVAGNQQRRGITHYVIPDRIEAGTFLVAAAATSGDVTILDVIPKHLEPITAKLKETGAVIIAGDDWVRLVGPARGMATDVRTLPYPGFPTDLQQPLSSFLTTCQGTSLVVENIFENRFRFTDELIKMGANIKVEGRTAIIEGVKSLTSAEVEASDLRAASALVIAGLAAPGESRIVGLSYLNRGYWDFARRLTSLGARLEIE